MLSDRDYMRTNRWAPQERGSVILPLIVLNIVVFLFCTYSGEGGDHLLNSLLLHPYYIRRFQLWRLVTYQFAHGGFTHILFNMWGLYLFGRLMERTLGSGRFLVLYLVSGIIGALTWLLFNWNDPVMALAVAADGTRMQVGMTTPSKLVSYVAEHGLTIEQISGGVIGASGSLFGVMTATAMAFPDLLVSLVFPPVTLRMRTMVLVYMLVELFACFTPGSSIAHLAHLGGALGGFLFMNRLRNPRSLSLWARLRYWWYRLRHPVGQFQGRVFYDNDELRRILSKVAHQGYASLTPHEKQILEEATDRLKR